MNKAKKVIVLIISIVAWLLIWELGASIVNNSAFLVGAPETLKALGALVVTVGFWKTVFLSMFRIAIGFLLGVVIGILLAFICHKSSILRNFFSLGFSVIKSTPVASIIMILWICIGGAKVASAIAIFMVAPIIWQNLLDGFGSIDKGLIEFADVFEISGFKRFKLLVFPALVRYFVPAALTSVGLAWKSGIAAEIITVAKNSIGFEIKNHKDYFESDYMLAWTLVVVIISVLFESIIRFLLRRFNRYECKD
jgi:NitT/TauT family transport system permease protein